MLSTSGGNMKSMRDGSSVSKGKEARNTGYGKVGNPGRLTPKQDTSYSPGPNLLIVPSFLSQ